MQDQFSSVGDKSLFVSEAVLLVTWMCVDHSMIDHIFNTAKCLNLFSRNLISLVTNMSDRSPMIPPAMNQGPVAVVYMAVQEEVASPNSVGGPFRGVFC